MIFMSRVPERSYMYPFSMRNFSSAIGCYVPYLSIVGMWISSMNTMSFLPGCFGPNIRPDRLSMLSSIVACRSEDVVLDEKLIARRMYWSGFRSLARNEEMITDLAVPEWPTNMHGRFSFFSLMCCLMIQEQRFVSTVGTRILENLRSAGGTYSVTSFSQAMKFLDSFQSQQLSNSEEGGNTRPEILRRNSSNFLRDSGLRQAPRLHTMQKIQMNSTASISQIGSSSSRIESSIRVIYSTRFRFVRGISKCNG